MMKKNRPIIGMLATLSLAALATGCNGDHQRMDYSLRVTLEGTQPHDSATLLVLEDDYNRLRVCGNARNDGNTFKFTGQTDGAKAAIIRWDSDTVHPFHFVLESGQTSITIKAGSWAAEGSPCNAEYLRYVNQRNAIVEARVATWQQYLKLASDSTLKREDERRLAQQDSLLNDSLQRITVERINRGDAVSRIIRERYASQLDQEHARKLK